MSFCKGILQTRARSALIICAIALLSYIHFCICTSIFFNRRSCDEPQINLFQRCVVVQEVFPEGLVSQDGRLKPGDQLIEINGIDMTTASHHQVSFGSHTSHKGNSEAHSASIQWLTLAHFCWVKRRGADHVHPRNTAVKTPWSCISTQPYTLTICGANYCCAFPQSGPN